MKEAANPAQKEAAETNAAGDKILFPATPWLAHNDGLPEHIAVYEGTIYGAIERIAAAYPRAIAFDFMGKPTTYKRFLMRIHDCAKSLKTIGVRAGDRVTIAMPNCPQAICVFYAVNLIGAVANMIHPLSAEKEIEFYLNESESVTAITLDQFYHKFENIRAHTRVVNIVIASIKDELSPRVKAGYMLMEGRKQRRIPRDAPVIRWNQFLTLGKSCFYNYRVERKADDVAAILYSGGTSGKSKGILLTNRNFNALAAQIKASNPMLDPGDKMLAAMPIFHGFGLGACIHAMLYNAARCVLVPRFTAKSYAKLIKKYSCNFIAGVPTLYEELLRSPVLKTDTDLSYLKGVFSGGDSLSVELKKKLDSFLHAHHAAIQVREGYGTTETVTTCSLMPPFDKRAGSIGIPCPDNYMKIVRPGTEEEAPVGTQGEILIAGPTVMKGYLNHPEETEKVLRKHKDGLTWVCTGDIGKMDKDGFFYFLGRAKRMIISSGYNIYPAQIENIIDSNEYVQMSCVVGVPDPVKIQAVKAFIVLRADIPGSERMKEEILSYCKKRIAKFALPREIEFRKELPKTPVGKVDYKKLEEEEERAEATRADARRPDYLPL